MHLILFLIFGLVIGALARLIVPGHEPGGWLTSMGRRLGAYLGGFVGRAIGLSPTASRAPGGWFVSLVGAQSSSPAIYHTASGRRPRTS